MHELRQDLRYGLRRLAGSPGFTFIAIASLAIGIGANTAIFSIVNAVLFRDLPVANADRLVEIYTSDAGGTVHATSSWPDFTDLRAASDIFQEVVAYQLFLGQVEREGGGSELIIGELVSGNYFSALGLTPSPGRGFLPEDDATPGTHPVIVLGHSFWQRAWGGDPGIVGSTVRINRRPYTVVGIAPASWGGMWPALEADVFAPYMMVGQIMPADFDRLESRGSRSMFLKGLLRPGVSVAQAGAAVEVIADRLARAWPESNEGRRMSVVASTDVAVHPVVDRALVPVAALLLAVVGMVLLIACANLASFLLARAADRRREIAIRLALGARRIRLVRQLLTESVLLALAGGTAGILVAVWATRALESFQPPLPIPIRIDVGLDARVLAFTAIVSILAGLAFGLLPGLQATNPDISPTLRDEAGNVTGGRRRVNLRSSLVVAQVAVSLLLLVGSGLFLRSLQKAQRIDPGFDTGPAAILWPNLELSGIDGERARNMWETLVARMRALPGVTAVALADRLPLGAAVQTRMVNVPGVTPPPGRDGFDVDHTWVDAEYFRAMAVPIVAGRNFTGADHADAPAVAIVSETAARAWWPNADPVGQIVYDGNDRSRPMHVIGVARDTRVRTLGEAPRPYLYLHALQTEGPALQIIIRGPRDDQALAAAARSEALAVDPDLVIMEAKTMEQHLALLLFPPRMAALLLSVFGAIALGLSAIGLYGLISYTVARRTREVGIRMALGADARSVTRLVTRGGVRLILIGAAIGMVLAAALSWSIARYLYGIQPTDVFTFASVLLVLATAGVLASWLPARRATRVDPLIALRAD